jgi:hypothetical protein
MQQYTFEDQYKGKPRKLLILMPQDGLDYRVFCDASFLGSIRPVQDDNGVTWKTEYNILKPVAKKIGESIESQQRSAVTGQ